MAKKVETLPNRVPKGEYHISFDTRGTPGFIRAVKVTVEIDMIPDDSGLPQDMQEKYRVDLADHPLYAELQRYVKANPR